jgi:hypothetical protein
MSAALDFLNAARAADFIRVQVHEGQIQLLTRDGKHPEFDAGMRQHKREIYGLLTSPKTWPSNVLLASS